MAKKQTPISYADLSDYQKFTGTLEGFKDILNPKLVDNFIMLTNRYVDGEREKIKNEQIAPELQEIEKMLLQYRIYCRYAKEGHGPGGALYLSCVVKKIKELYGS